MKLVLIGPVYPFRGGIAHYTTVLRNELVARGHDVLVISFRRQYPAWLFPGRTDRDPSAKPLDASGALYILDMLKPWTWWQAIRVIRAHVPERVVLQWWQAVWSPVWLVIEIAQRLAHTPVTVICHNVLPHERRPLDAALARAVLGLADRALVQSTSERDDLHRLLPGKPVDVVPHPLYDMLATARISKKEARVELGLPDSAPVLLFFGFVRKYKGLDYLLAAMPAIMAVFPDVRLLVAGEFWGNRAEYERKIAAADISQHVTLVDRYIPNEETGLYFAAADLVTLPYASATQSGVLQMALGFDRPVVATRVGGLAEAVDPGDDVVLTEPRNARALAEAIIGFFQTPTSRGVASSRARSKERWGQVVDAVVRDK